MPREHTTHHDDCGCLSEQIGELLAVIHRDGGHHTARVGLRQSIADAKQKVIDSRRTFYCSRAGCDYHP